jgi:AraC-like DNA-binding protein
MRLGGSFRSQTVAKRNARTHPASAAVIPKAKVFSAALLGVLFACAQLIKLQRTMNAQALTNVANAQATPLTPRLPLERFRLFESRDVDEARDFVARVFCPHELSPLHREMSLDACHHNAPLHRDASLNYVQYGPAVRIEPGFLDSFYLLQIPLRGGASVRCGKRSVESHPLLASIPSPTEPLSMRWHADSPQLIVKMDRQALRGRLEGLLQAPLRESLDFDLGADLTAPSAQGLVSYIACLRAMLDGDAGLLGRELMAEQAENHLLTSVLLSLRHNHTDQLTAGSTSATRHSTVLPRIVKRAQEYMRAHADAPITLADVCGYVGVSARSLQLAFDRHHGLSPMVYLRDLRLDLVRKELLAQNSDAVHRTRKVTEAAIRYGFLHLGHFAARYRERFREAPSDTLLRARLGGKP